ncbi:MAG: hypothetical protein LUD12_10475 [Lachnospiraceae bacterium]|nr:hypothetical protein [Lachnospiraceae bacterium]
MGKESEAKKNNEIFDGETEHCGLDSERPDNGNGKCTCPMARKYLGQVFEFHQHIDEKQAELNSYRDLLESIRGCDFDEHFNATRSADPPFVTFANKVVDLEAEIKDDTAALGRMKFEVGQTIDQLPSWNERVVLRYRYLLLLPWRTVAQKMGFTKRWVLRVHDRALGSFERMLLEDEERAKPK